MDEKVYIHPSSWIDPPCRIGAGTRIWHFCHIMRGARIGRDCTLGQNVMVAPGVWIGNGVKIQNNVSVYTGVVCEDDVFLGPSCVFTNVINPRSFIARREEFRRTRVRRGASIGANATILCGVTIGRYALVGAGAVVTHSLPDFAVAVGSPARILGYVCRCGNRLQFDGGEARCSCGGRYRIGDNGQVEEC